MLFYTCKKIILLSLITFYSSFLIGQINCNEKNYALSGFDPVSYFQNEPKIGQERYKVVRDSVTYLFYNNKNKVLFEENPELYLPQYGGWCAYAMGNSGKKVSINPKSYSIEQNKLYLFYKTNFVNTKKKWLKNTPDLKAKAAENWKKIKP